MGVVYLGTLNWFSDDNLRTKIQIEARCGMYVYLMNIHVKYNNDDFRQLLPELCPFLYFKFANFLVSGWYHVNQKSDWS